jgi:histidyl-tRNA synthetase
MFGIDNIEADVEVISLAYRIMKNFGAKDEDFQIKVNDRRLLQQKMEGKLINKDLYPAAVRLLDKKDKMPKDEFEKKWAELSQEPFKMDADANETIDQIITKLGEAGIKNAVYAPVLTRGFDYYTGMVFEIFDTDPENRRSIFGGGRYDDLTSLFDGDLPAGQTNKIPAVGFGVGDVTIRDFLETHNLLPPLAGAADIHICTLEERFIGDAQALAAKLREKGLNISVNLTKKKIGDQIGWADKHHIPEVIVIGENEAKSGKFKVKTLATGEEKELS